MDKYKRGYKIVGYKGLKGLIFYDINGNPHFSKTNDFIAYELAQEMKKKRPVSLITKELK